MAGRHAAVVFVLVLAGVLNNGVLGGSNHAGLVKTGNAPPSWRPGAGVKNVTAPALDGCGCGPTPPPWDFLNQKLAALYPVIQAFKRRITCDPLGVTSSWVGTKLCDSFTGGSMYKGFYCAYPPNANTTLTIASIDFNGYGLCAPSLAGFVDAFPDLALFHANSNNFSGDVPDLTSLPFFYELDLSNNNFSGAFPDTVVPLGGLLFLDLRFNRFAGTVPPPGVQPHGRGALPQQQRLHGQHPGHVREHHGRVPRRGQQPVHGPDPALHLQHVGPPVGGAVPQQRPLRVPPLRDRAGGGAHAVRRRRQRDHGAHPAVVRVPRRRGGDQPRREPAVRARPRRAVPAGQDGEADQPVAVGQLLPLGGAPLHGAGAEQGAGRAPELHPGLPRSAPAARVHLVLRRPAAALPLRAAHPMRPARVQAACQ